MEQTNTPDDGQQNQAGANNTEQEQPQVDDLAELARLADEAAEHPQTSPPLRELMPILARVVRQHAEVLALLGA